MFKYALQRFLYMLLVLLIISCMCFILIRMLPAITLPPGDPHTAVIERQRELQGYNEPYLVQFGIYLKNIVTEFDWGISDKIFWGRDVWEVFVELLPASMIVKFYSIILSIPIGIALISSAMPAFSAAFHASSNVNWGALITMLE